MKIDKRWFKKKLAIKEGKVIKTIREQEKRKLYYIYPCVAPGMYHLQSFDIQIGVNKPLTY